MDRAMLLRFEGLEADDRMDLQSITSQISTHLKDIRRKKSIAKKKLEVDLEGLIKVIDGLISRPRPTPSPNPTKPPTDIRARQIIREFVNYIDSGAKLDDDFVEGLQLRAQLLAEYYTRNYLKAKAEVESRVWVPDEEIQGEIDYNLTDMMWSPAPSPARVAAQDQQRRQINDEGIEGEVPLIWPHAPVCFRPLDGDSVLGWSDENGGTASSTEGEHDNAKNSDDESEENDDESKEDDDESEEDDDESEEDDDESEEDDDESEEDDEGEQQGDEDEERRDEGKEDADQEDDKTDNE